MNNSEFDEYWALTAVELQRVINALTHAGFEANHANIMAMCALGDTIARNAAFRNFSEQLDELLAHLAALNGGVH